jgi:hypothetical protein
MMTFPIYGTKKIIPNHQPVMDFPGHGHGIFWVSPMAAVEVPSSELDIGV